VKRKTAALWRAQVAIRLAIAPFSGVFLTIRRRIVAQSACKSAAAAGADSVSLADFAGISCNLPRGAPTGLSPDHG
jgi:hypothetical protein